MPDHMEPLTEINVLSTATVGEVVTPSHFGVNYIYGVSSDPDGSGSEQFWEGSDALGVTNVRFPGGSVSEEAIDITEMPDGELLPEVVAFFEELKDMQRSNTQVNLVIRTREAENETAQAYHERIEKFAEAVTGEYGDLIASFQIGNEYWGSGRFDEQGYGAQASIAAEALAKGIAAANNGFDPDIVIQMGNPSTSRSIFSKAAVDEMIHKSAAEQSEIEMRFLEYASEQQGVAISDLNTSWLWDLRLEFANIAIIEELSPEAVDAVDAVVEHYYLKNEIEEQHLNFGEKFGSYNSQMVSSIDKKYLTWDAHFDKELVLYITEWSTHRDNHAQLGMRGAGITLEMFEYMIKMGVDSAYAWPVQHNTPNALAGKRGDRATETAAGDNLVVNNTPRGAVFDLMSSSLIGLNQIELEHDLPDGKIEINAYADDDKLVVYLSSRSEAIEHISFNAGDLAMNAIDTSAIKIGYGETYAAGSDPVDFLNGNYASSVDFGEHGGETLFYNDHMMSASVEKIDEISLLASDGAAEFTLLPYEVVEITYHFSEETHFMGSEEDDILFGSLQDDIYNGGAGNDLFYASEGGDHFRGGTGRDIVDYSMVSSSVVVNLAWRHANQGDAYGDIYIDIEGLRGSTQDDLIIASVFADLVWGGEGDDEIIGRAGNDTLFGDEGNDRLIGHIGGDRIDGGAGNDQIFGDPGNDWLQGGKGDDFLRGGRGADVFIFRAGDGVDEISDFNPDEDILQLREFMDVSHEAFNKQFHINDTGDLELKLSETDIIRFNGLTQEDVEHITSVTIFA